jgi:ethanolamine utilization microcompartment shell protein EutS
MGLLGILALLGYYNTQLLASFNVLSANIGIFFVIATSGAVILQAEFAKLHQQIAQGSQLLINVLLLFLSYLACYMVLLCVWVPIFLFLGSVLFLMKPVIIY